LKKIKEQTIPDSVIDLMKQLECEGNIVKKWQGTLNPREYKQFDSVMQCLGGKWNRSKQGHVFPSDGQTIIDEATGNGTVRRRHSSSFRRQTNLLTNLSTVPISVISIRLLNRVPVTVPS
jgi:hypothetical protein